MKNNNKYILSVIIWSSLLVLLSACSNDVSSDSISDSAKSEKKDMISSAAVNDRQLSILAYKCSGCGRCAIIDSEHFVMKNNKAEIVSINNLNSTNLLTAVSACHRRAIELL